MKWLSDRISFYRHDEYTTILISTKVEQWKLSLILGWMLLWSLIGLIIFFVITNDNYLIELAVEVPIRQLQLFLVVFLVFWAYYLYKIIRIYIWRKKGVEYFKLDKDSLIIKKAFGKIGKANSYQYENILNLKLVEISPGSFSRIIEGSFWDIGNETLQFDYYGKQIVFGIQLGEEEARSLKQFLCKEISIFIN